MNNITLYWDLNNNLVKAAPADELAIARIDWKRGDDVQPVVRFCRGSTAVPVPKASLEWLVQSGLTFKAGLRPMPVEAKHGIFVPAASSSPLQVLQPSSSWPVAGGPYSAGANDYGVLLATNGAGTPISTIQEVADAINNFWLDIQCAVTGTPTDVCAASALAAIADWMDVPEAEMAAKVDGGFGADLMLLCQAEDVRLGQDDDGMTYLSFPCALRSEALADVLANSPNSPLPWKDLDLEFHIGTAAGGDLISSATINLRVFNDVHVGTESVPTLAAH